MDFVETMKQFQADPDGTWTKLILNDYMAFEIYNFGRREQWGELKIARAIAVAQAAKKQEHVDTLVDQAARVLPYSGVSRTTT